MTATKAKSEVIALANLTVDQGINPRAGGTSEVTAQEYADAIEAGDVFPAAVVYRDRAGTLWLSEGFTRRRAFELAGRYGMPCEVRPGGRREAAINAAGSNHAHGQRRTTADKRLAVKIVLSVEPQWTDRRIAEVVFVDNKTVADVRCELERSAEIPQITKRVGLDGRERSLPQPKTRIHTPSPASTLRSTPSVVPPPKLTIHTPDPRADFEADVDVVCVRLAEVVVELERLAGTAFAKSIGAAKAIDHVRKAIAAVWADRKGDPPGAV